MKFEILDCTLRDGGYYTQWDFEESLVNGFLSNLQELPIDFVEIGYRSPPKAEYHGEYFYLPEQTIKRVKQKIPNKKLAIILNAKDLQISDIPLLLNPLSGIVSLIRIAVNPDNIDHSISLAEEIKKYDFNIAFNIMYLSKWIENEDFIKNLFVLDSLVDYLYLVDSYGSVYPSQIKPLISILKKKLLKTKLGFHGHDNLSLALANSLVAIDSGIDIIDATVLGMGRGAGNLKMELFLTACSAKYGYQINYSSLTNLVELFKPLHEDYSWGASMPYHISGAFDIPQAHIMKLLQLKRYSSRTIVNTIVDRNEMNSVQDFDLRRIRHEKSLIVGGGKSFENHQAAIEKFLKKYDCNVFMLGCKNLNSEIISSNDTYVAISGDDLCDLNENELLFLEKSSIILDNSNSAINTVIDERLKNNTFKTRSKYNEQLEFTSQLSAVFSILEGCPGNEIFFIGMDGYQDNLVLHDFNSLQLNRFVKRTKKKLISLNQTLYSELVTSSIYTYL